MRVLRAFPPNFTHIAKVFPFIRGKQGILYAYGDTLYNPSGVPVTPWIAAHEAIHMARQKAQGVTDWWGSYLTNPTFRLDEEVLAHRAEWATFKLTKYSDNQKARYLTQMAERLSSPLYGGLVLEHEAMALILGGTNARLPSSGPRI
jgi:hypothetical protein